VAILAVLTVVLVSGSQITIVAAILAAIYVGYWLATPRPWSVWLALLTAPAALAAIARSETGQVTYLLWVCPALAIGFAIIGARAVAVLVVLVGAAVASSLLRSGHPSLHAVLQVALPITLAFLAATAVRRLQGANQELARAREQLAVAAVEEERTRFARDLHDLLGHSLTVLVAKIRLARRLPADQAATELADAEHLTRAVLDDVRQAVEGYRGPTLDAQIAGAKAALGAAGITFEVVGGASPLVEDAEHVLALCVREAVTNVLRHSGASLCVLTLGRDETEAWADIRDDGRGGEVVSGWGLQGLRERAHRLGGSIAWDAPPGGGFHVRVTVLADKRADELVRL
jgi:two-component system sensor histidine kinase DesK